MYADVEDLLITKLGELRPNIRFVVDIPADLAKAFLTFDAVAQVIRFGGGDDDLTLDAANVDIDVIAPNRTAARLAGEQIRSDMRLRMVGYFTGTAVVASVGTISGPSWVPYDNTNVRRMNSAYRVIVHSTP